MTATTSPCPTSGTLRAHLDLPDPAVEAHVTECPDCDTALLGVAETAGTVATLLAGLATEEDALPVQRTVGGRHPNPSPGRGAAQSRPPREGGRRRLRRMAALGLTVIALAALSLPAGRGAVAQLLDGFRAEQVQVVPLDLTDLRSFDPALLAGLAEVTDADLAEPVRVADADAAREISGLVPFAVPDGVSGDVTYAATPGGDVRITFTPTADNGLAPELADTILVVTVPPAVVTTVEGPQMLMLVRAGTLSARSEGAELAAVRDALLGLDGLPEGLRQQLSSITDWETTLPVPLPDGLPGAATVTIAGTEGIAVSDGVGLGAGVLWLADGETRAVGGIGTLDRMLVIAESL